jgi:large conductance mechanosensitive channel
MSFIKEFKQFVSQGNVIDLAIGVVIGGAFGKIVTSLVNDIVMPLVNPLIPGGDWKKLVVGPGIKVGSFLGTLLDFVIIAFAVFVVIKALNATRIKNEKKEI